ncbi:MAG TPA: flagellar motor switch protein FliG [Syntrophorhabdaceae bacterium]|jgi:flagellar motor switch protein FliG|nr:flagellar motor switch protein FliG [Syntrophorhabdaceae bacterium]HOG39578.1 flagellar motor switch protein FliG [Syntrophorhabdaceae bacterium]HPN98562.1 flagellar motor switch protein FliG [Syntrophorhabdaceae bacterium]HQP51525.1 flagellar motor switch protein FliG [Syntrophorhabdaceae bacterium]
MDVADITGTRKAAILLLTMDEELSKELLKEFERHEIEAIGKEIANIKYIPENIVKQVHSEFLKNINKSGAAIVDGQNKFKTLLKKSFGDDTAENFFDAMAPKEGVPGDYLKTCDPKILAGTIKGEHPQTISLIVSLLPSKKACDVIAMLPGNLQGDVITRMAKLGRVDKSVLLDIEDIIQEQLQDLGVGEEKQMGGISSVANILNQMDKIKEGEILGALEEMNPELAEKIKQLMFTFEDLVKLDNKSVQSLLKEIASEELAIALKGASDTIKEKIFSNMSERASAMLKEDLEAMGPVRLSEVGQAQTKIALTAKRLEAEGKIIITGENEKFV